MKSSYTLYIGTCRPDGQIRKFELSGNGTLKETANATLGNVMYITRENNRLHYLLRTTESGDFGAASSCTDNLTDITENITSNGLVPCHLTRFKGNTYAVNYLSGSVTKIGFNTVVHTPYHDMKPGRQDAPHTHCVTPTPDGEYLMVTDLGMDTITVCDKDLNTVSVCNMPTGHGVRHLVCGENNLVYSSNELKATVSVLKYNPEEKNLTVIGTYNCFKEGNPVGNTAAAIRISSDYKYLYVSNRGANVICAFSIKNDGQVLDLIESKPSEGLIPWDFDITSDDKFLVCACKGSGLVNVFELNNGRIGKLVNSVSDPEVICVKIDR